ncbi:Plectin/S10 domain-containing protein [Multifurca ochricompacta]|uniref:Plectin/S10 domain-containing protein n=1 Tax=Multifurca ochricompacta TaxID=376703 RepID=A0AAD4LW33_9AGAM|nr:Plectin/S10 domain-containing protein [Multifurca ochricompacta]
MIISKENKRTIYQNLFKEGVLVAKKDFNAPKHEELEVPNLEVIKALQSLTSRGYVKTQFSWQWYYYTLTPEGVEYLREWLHLPAEVVPETHRKPIRARPAQGRPGGGGVVVVVRVPIVLLAAIVAIATITVDGTTPARRMVHRASFARSLLALVVAVLGSRWVVMCVYMLAKRVLRCPLTHSLPLYDSASFFSG